MSLLVIADSGHALPHITAISILGLECCTIAFSAAELGSIAEFWDLHVLPGNGANAMYICGLLLASCDDKAAWFEKEQERRHSHEHSHK